MLCHCPLMYKTAMSRLGQSHHWHLIREGRTGLWLGKIFLFCGFWGWARTGWHEGTVSMLVGKGLACSPVDILGCRCRSECGRVHNTCSELKWSVPPKIRPWSLHEALALCTPHIPCPGVPLGPPPRHLEGVGYAPAPTLIRVPMSWYAVAEQHEVCCVGILFLPTYAQINAWPWFTYPLLWSPDYHTRDGNLNYSLPPFTLSF